MSALKPVNTLLLSVAVRGDLPICTSPEVTEQLTSKTQPQLSSQRIQVSQQTEAVGRNMEHSLSHELFCTKNSIAVSVSQAFHHDNTAD